MKLNYKIFLAALAVAFITAFGCDNASKKAENTKQMKLLVLTCMSCHNSPNPPGTTCFFLKNAPKEQ